MQGCVASSIKAILSTINGISKSEKTINGIPRNRGENCGFPPYSIWTIHRNPQIGEKRFVEKSHVMGVVFFN